MPFTPNRLETHWDAIMPLLLQEWPELTESELEATGKQFDKLVALIRERCGGRASIIQEASIRTRLNQILDSWDR